MGKRTVNEKEIKRFLKERGLTKAYQTDQRIKRLPKLKDEVIFSNYDNTSRRSRIVISREGNKTVVRDFRTMSVLASSRKSIDQVHKDIFSTVKDNKKFKVKTEKGKWNITNKRTGKKIKLKNSVKHQTYNKTYNRLRTITSTNKITKKEFGFAVVDAVYINGQERRRVQARSRGGYNLKTEKDQAINDAIRNGSVIAEFSPTDVEIIDYWFEIWTDKYEKIKKL